MGAPRSLKYKCDGDDDSVDEDYEDNAEETDSTEDAEDDQVNNESTGKHQNS